MVHPAPANVAAKNVAWLIAAVRRAGLAERISIGIDARHRSVAVSIAGDVLVPMLTIRGVAVDRRVVSDGRGGFIPRTASLPVATVRYGRIAIRLTLYVLPL